MPLPFLAITAGVADAALSLTEGNEIGFASDKVLQLKLYYLFMCADGKISEQENALLTEIAVKMNLEMSYIQDYRNYRKQIEEKMTVNNPRAVISEIDDLLEEKDHSHNSIGMAGVTAMIMAAAMFRSCINRDKNLQVQTLWTLINLGYADNEYTRSEREVVDHLIKRWDIDPMIVSELVDTAETLLAISLQKEWVQTTNKSYSEKNQITQELDRSTARIFKNVEAIISEANI